MGNVKLVFGWTSRLSERYRPQQVIVFNSTADAAATCYHFRRKNLPKACYTLLYGLSPTRNIPHTGSTPAGINTDKRGGARENAGDLPRCGTQARAHKKTTTTTRYVLKKRKRPRPVTFHEVIRPVACTRDRSITRSLQR